RLFDIVFEIRVARIPTVHGTWEAHTVRIPIQQVKRVRRCTLQIVVDDIAPDQIIGTQRAKGEGQFLSRKYAALPDRGLSQRDRALVDQETNLACIGEIEHGGQQCEGHKLVLLARGQDGRGAAQDRTAHAEPKGMRPLGAGNLQHDVNCPKWPHLKVIIPRQMTGFGYRAPPRDQKDMMAMRDGVLNERISGAKVKQIILVDAWWHDEQGRLLDLAALRSILNQLN